MATNLSTLVGGRVPDYLEFGWVTAPNVVGSTITANTSALLTIDTEIRDTGNKGSVSSNIVTIDPGTYYYEVMTKFVSPGSYSSQYLPSVIVVLRSNTGIIGRGQGKDSEGSNSSNNSRDFSSVVEFNGQFVTASSLDLSLVAIAGGVNIIPQFSSYPSTFSVFGTDQRNTIKLWKLK